MTTLTRRAVLGGSLGLAGLAATGTLRPTLATAADKPDIISCGDWGAKDATGTIKMVGPPKTIVIHHTASENVTESGSFEGGGRGSSV